MLKKLEDNADESAEDLPVEMCRVISQSMGEDEYEDLIQDTNLPIREERAETPELISEESKVIRLPVLRTRGKGKTPVKRVIKMAARISRDQKSLEEIMGEIQYIIVENTVMWWRMSDNMDILVRMMRAKYDRGSCSAARQPMLRQEYSYDNHFFDGFHNRQERRKEQTVDVYADESCLKTTAILSIFKQLLKQGMELPPVISLEEAEKVGHPLYCPYHRMVGHQIMACRTFRRQVQRQINSGTLLLAPSYLKKTSRERHDLMFLGRRDVNACLTVVLDDDTNISPLGTCVTTSHGPIGDESERHFEGPT